LNDDVEEHQVDESSLLDCIDAEGGLKIKNFMLRQQEVSLLELSILNEAGLIDNSNSPCGSRVTIAVIRPFIHWHTRCNLYEVWDGDSQRAATPHDSTWWKIYIEHPMLNIPKFHRLFRRRFRMPYDQFIQYVSDAKQHNWFPRWSKCNSTSPIELLILGGFCYLGRGWTFDDLEESTMISAKVHCNYFHQFIIVGADILFPLYVLTPTTVEECQTHMHGFAQAGINGAIGSSDATHI
jgi:hypothetical protein